MSFNLAVLAAGTPLHSWQAVGQANSRPAYKAGIQASAYMAAAALECLEGPNLLRDARLELEAQVARSGYAEPVAADAPVPTFKDLYDMEL